LPKERSPESKAKRNFYREYKRNLHGGRNLAVTVPLEGRRPESPRCAAELGRGLAVQGGVSNPEDKYVRFRKNLAKFYARRRRINHPELYRPQTTTQGCCNNGIDLPTEEGDAELLRFARSLDSTTECAPNTGATAVGRVSSATLADDCSAGEIVSAPDLTCEENLEDNLGKSAEEGVEVDSGEAAAADLTSKECALVEELLGDEAFMEGLFRAKRKIDADVVRRLETANYYSPLDTVRAMRRARSQGSRRYETDLGGHTLQDNPTLAFMPPVHMGPGATVADGLGERDQDGELIDEPESILGAYRRRKMEDLRNAPFLLPYVYRSMR